MVEALEYALGFFIRWSWLMATEIKEGYEVETFAELGWLLAQIGVATVILANLFGAIGHVRYHREQKAKVAGG